MAALSTNGSSTRQPGERIRLASLIGITGADIGMGSANGGGSSVAVIDFKNQWEDTGWGDFGVELGYAHTNASEVSAATSSVAN